MSIMLKSELESQKRYIEKYVREESYRKIENFSRNSNYEMSDLVLPEGVYVDEKLEDIVGVLRSNGVPLRLGKISLNRGTGIFLAISPIVAAAKKASIDIGLLANAITKNLDFISSVVETNRFIIRKLFAAPDKDASLSNDGIANIIGYCMKSSSIEFTFALISHLKNSETSITVDNFIQIAESFSKPQYEEYPLEWLIEMAIASYPSCDSIS